MSSNSDSGGSLTPGDDSLNLIDNAIHYNKQRGEIRIAADAQNGTVRLSVTDTGNGIPSEELPRIFERFYRVDKARSRESGGTGLGLSIVKHAIESQGGSITVASKLGRARRLRFTCLREGRLIRGRLPKLPN